VGEGLSIRPKKIIKVGVMSIAFISV